MCLQRQQVMSPKVSSLGSESRAAVVHVSAPGQTCQILTNAESNVDLALISNGQCCSLSLVGARRVSSTDEQPIPEQ